MTQQHVEAVTPKYVEILSPTRAASDLLNPSSALGEAALELLDQAAGARAALPGRALATRTLPIAGWNTRRFQQSVYSRNIHTTPDGVVYVAVWGFDKNPYLCIGRVGSERWTLLNLRTIPGDPFGELVDDVHNTLSVITDASGRIHVWGNVHTTPLRYARTSAPGDPSTFAAATIPGGHTEVTYPDPFMVDGVLLLMYRNGYATEGQTYLTRWDDAAATWSTPKMLVNGAPSKEGPYASPVLVYRGQNGRWKFGFFGTWRSDGSAHTCSGFWFVESDDFGATLTRADGAVQAMPMTHANSVDVIPVAHGSGIVNQEGGAYDEHGRPRCAITLYDAAGKTQYHLVHYDGAVWGNEQLTEFTKRMETGTAEQAVTTLLLDVARPHLVCYDGRDYLLGRTTYDGHNGRPFIIDATPGADHRPAHIADMDLVGWEPGAFDLGGIARGELNILITPIDQHADSERNYDRQWLGVITIRLDRLADVRAGLVKLPTIRPLPGTSAATPYAAVVGGTAEAAVPRDVLARAFIASRTNFPGRRLFVKARGRIGYNTGTSSGAIFLRASNPNATPTSEEDVCRMTLEKADSHGFFETPWEPLLLSPYLGSDGKQRDTLLTPWAVANHAAGLNVENFSIVVGYLDA